VGLSENFESLHGVYDLLGAFYFPATIELNHREEGGRRL